MFFNSRYKTAGGFKFSVFYQGDHGYSPREIRIHAPISQNLDSWDDVIIHEIKDCLQSNRLTHDHDIRVEVYSPRWTYLRSGNMAYIIILRGSQIRQNDGFEAD